MTERSDRSVERGTDAYDGGSITLHWLLAALIVVAFFMGLYLVELPFSPLRIRLFNGTSGWACSCWRCRRSVWPGMR